MFVDRILEEVLPEETGAARLQQLGLFTLIFVLEQRGEAVTSTRLVELTGQARSSLYKQLDKLEKVDIITRTKATNNKGRSFVYLLSIKHNDKTKRLIAALGKSDEPKSRAKPR